MRDGSGFLIHCADAGRIFGLRFTQTANRHLKVSGFLSHSERLCFHRRDFKRDRAVVNTTRGCRSRLFGIRLLRSSLRLRRNALG